MSVSTAFQSLRLPARSIASRQGTHRSLALSGLSTGSTSADGTQSPRSASARHLAARSPQSHAPHGLLDKEKAGPSRCFCTSHRSQKASELPLGELQYHESFDGYQHSQLPTSNDYWRSSDTTRSPLRSREPPTHARQASQHITQPGLHSSSSIRSLLAHEQGDTRQSAPDSSCNGFFTPSAQQNTHHDAMPEESIASHTPLGSVSATGVTFIESLEPSEREALDDRMRMLIRSGERSMPALSAEYNGITPEDDEQIRCHILSQCIDDEQDAQILWDLYRTWTPSLSPAAFVFPTGPARVMLRRKQSTTLYRCCMYLQASGLVRQAGIVAGDARLKPSQSRYLLERLAFDLRVSANFSATQNRSKLSDANAQLATTTRFDLQPFTAADTRLAVRQISDGMTNLMADGTAFKRKTLNRVFKLLCLTGARSRVVQFLRAAQRRAQIDSSIAQTGIDGQHDGILRAAGGFSRFRSEQVKVPQVISTKVMEEALRVLCAQDSTGARTAYDVLRALDVSQRSAPMYDALMTVYGNSVIHVTTAVRQEDSSPRLDSSTEVQPCNDAPGKIRYVKIDEELWTEICTLAHIGGPTLHTMSARIVCHARSRKLELVKSDLVFLRTSHLGTIHDLTENAKLSIIRCCIESGSLLTAFRYASVLLTRAIAAHNITFQPKIIHTLLRAAQHIRIPSTNSTSSSTPSKAQLLKRFLHHFSHLHSRFPQLHLEFETLNLLIQLLNHHQHWIATETLWIMLRVVGKHFSSQDQRFLTLLKAFINIFESRQDTNSATQLKALLEKLHQQSKSTDKN